MKFEVWKNNIIWNQSQEKIAIKKKKKPARVTFNLSSPLKLSHKAQQKILKINLCQEYFENK